MLLLYFLFWTAVAANKEPLYGEIGDKAVLTPDSVVNPITSIEWKHGPDLAIDWYGDEPTAYRHFKDRGSLNTSNGALTITGLTPDDSGNYTVEINNRVTSKIELLVVSPVPKPNITSWCDPEMTYCVLTCNGDTTGVELVTYWWTSDITTWSSTKEHNITKEDKELWFRCAFKKPVSFKSSEIVFNPFKEKTLYAEIDDQAVLTADSEESLITSIVWKHGPDIAVEWDGGKTTAYRHFKGRGSLDTSNGELTITGLTPDDSGSYTVEINNKPTSKTELLVISSVSKPTITSWCVMTYCVLTCSSDTTGAEPVTYWWTADDTTWSSAKEHTITVVETEMWFIWFSCAFENPVSSSSSEKVFNPFIRNLIIFLAILFPVVCIIIITFGCKGIISISCELIKGVLKWTFLYISVCFVVFLNIIIIIYLHYEGQKEDWTWMTILIAVTGVILVGYIIIIIYLIYKGRINVVDYPTSTFISIAASFLNMFNFIIVSIYKHRTEDWNWMIIITAVVFGVALVGYIIIIYLIYKGRINVADGLIWLPYIFVIFFTMVIISLTIIVIHINKQEGATWMLNFIPVFILVGLIIISICLIYKGIIYFRRKRREQMSALLPPVETTSTQDPTSVVVQNTSNRTETSPMNPDNTETHC